MEGGKEADITKLTTTVCRLHRYNSAHLYMLYVSMKLNMHIRVYVFCM